MKQTENMQLEGDLTLNTVKLTRDRLLSQLKINGSKNIFVDLSTVNTFDTAGLALLIDLKRACVNYTKTLCFVNVPDSIKNLAKFYDVVEIFN